MARLSHISAEAQAALRVYDVADPSRHGTIIRAGPEVSEVRFDDGPERSIPNSHLRPVAAKNVELDNPVLGLLGPAGNAGKFLDPHKPASHPQTANAGDSNKSRNGSNPVVETELARTIREAKEQLQGKSSAA